MNNSKDVVMLSSEETTKVSVIIATFRRDQSLYNAIVSVSNQTYSNIEIVVVDDNADADWNNKVASIIDEVSKCFNCNIVYVKNINNQGSAKTRNIGVSHSNGAYISFLDDDDVYLPERIEMQLKDMISEKADYGITDLNLYNSNDKLVENRTRSYINDQSMESLLSYHLKYHMTGTDTLMFRREYFDLIGGFTPIDVGDEFYLMEKAIINNGVFCYSRQCYIKAYIHEGSELGLSSGIGKINGENALFENKKQYFDKMSKSDIKYITMRHYAVISFAYLRSKKYGAFVYNAIKAFFISPKGCYQLLKERK